MVSLIAAYLFDHPEYDRPHLGNSHSEVIINPMKNPRMCATTCGLTYKRHTFQHLQVNPFSKADWEGTGVEPDVKVKAPEALETAEKLAESKLQKK